MLRTDKKESLNFKLEKFEGPLDLLLSLISKNEVDINDIPIAMIFDQYMEYIDRMRELDMDIAGEFLTMAAELMLIKSRMLLPKVKNEENGEDPRADLTARLIAYQILKEVKEPMAELYAQFSGRSAKESDEIDIDRSFVAPHELEALTRALERIEVRRRIMEDSKNADMASSLNTIVVKKITPTDQKVVSILRLLKRNGAADFETILLNNNTRSDIVATFLATLSLIAKHIIYISSENEYNIPVLEINYDRRKEDNSNFNADFE